MSDTEFSGMEAFLGAFRQVASSLHFIPRGVREQMLFASRIREAFASCAGKQKVIPADETGYMFDWLVRKVMLLVRSLGPACSPSEENSLTIVELRQLSADSKESLMEVQQRGWMADDVSCFLVGKPRCAMRFSSRSSV